jgi:hypothetical protein
MDGWEKGREILARLDYRAEHSGEMLNALRQAVRSHWENKSPVGLKSMHFDWRSALSALIQYAEQVGDKSCYSFDPFAPNMSSPLIFKALHGMANQLGLDQLNEAYVYHLLLHAAGGAESGAGVPMMPEFSND